MSDLVDFLLARIAEDEADARAADGTRWLHQDKVVTFEAFGPDGDYVDASAPISVDTRANGWHIVRWSPQRVLAECTSKRQIIAANPIEHVELRRWRDADPFRVDEQIPEVLRLMATPYADHPNCRPEWVLRRVR